MKTQKPAPLPLSTAVVSAFVGLTAALTAMAPVQAQSAPPRTLSVWGDFLAGHHAEVTGDGAKALEFYTTAARKGITDSADLYSRMYILGLTEGRLDSALVALDKAEKLGGKAPLAMLTRAVKAFQNGAFKNAEDLLKDDETGIARILSPVLIAWARVGQKDVAGGLDVLQTVTEGNDAKPSPLFVLHSALINDVAGTSEAGDALFMALNDGAGLSVRTVELSGEHFERRGMTDRARSLYATLGNDAEAQILAQALERRLKANSPPPIDVDTAQKGAAEALYGVASAMLAQNAWESALALSNMALALRPDFPAAMMVAAAALQQNNRAEEATAMYAAVPRTSPFSWMARLHVADNLDRADKTGDAVDALKALIRERPTLVRPVIQLGDVQRRHENFKDAIASYSRAIELIGTPSEGDWGLFYSRGVSYEQSKQWPKAEADFLRALELSPDQPAVLNYLGYLWIDEGQNLERALDMIARAVEQRPRDGAIVDSLGWGYYRTGDFPTAVKHLERAVMLRPADPVINDHLGDALWQVGRTREAKFQWERALTMEPDAALLAEIEKKLKSGLAAAKP